MENGSTNAKCIPSLLCQNGLARDFPGDPVIKTSPSNAGGVDLIPGWGAKIPHAAMKIEDPIYHIGCGTDK